MGNELLRHADDRIEIDWGRLLTSNVTDLTAEEHFLAVSLLDAGTKAFDQRLSDLKAAVRADLVGDGIEAGTSRTAVKGGVKIQVTQKRATVAVNEQSLLALLSRKGLDPEHICFQKALQLDSSRLEQAIAGGVFTDEEVRAFTAEGKAPAASVQVKEYAMGITSKRLLGGA